MKSASSKFQKVKYNFLFSYINQFTIICIGILIPRLVLVSFGSEINGFLASVTQIYTYVALLEAGIGGATVQALYKPVAENDSQCINSILSATDKYYQKAGKYYLFAIIIFAAVYSVLVKTEIGLTTIIAVIVLSGLSGAINFLFQGKYILLLQAEGKHYIITNLLTLIHLLSGLSKITLMLLGFNVISLVLAYFIFNLIQTIYIIYYIKTRYKWLDLSVRPHYEAISQKNSVLVHQVAYLIFNNTDVLLLTIFTNLKLVSVYVLYSMLFSIIKTLIGNISGSVNFALGQIYNIDKKKFLIFHEIYEVLYITGSFILYTVAYFFILPFMKLYTSGVTDINYIDERLPVLFVAVHLLSSVRVPKGSIINFAGHFKKTQNRAIFESAINLLLSLIGVYYWGIYGVLVATIIALLYRSNDIIIYSSKSIIGINPLSTYLRIFYNLVMFIVISNLSIHLQIDLNSYLNIILWAAVYFIIVCVSYGLIAFLIEFKIIKTAYELFAPYAKNVLLNRGKPYR